MKTDIRAVLFDLDGVLCRTPDLHYRALNLALVGNGCDPISPERHRTVYNGLPTAIKLGMMIERGDITHDLSLLITHDKKVHTRRLIKDEVKFDPNVYCLVAGVVASGRKWGVVTNAISDTALDCVKILRFMPGVLVTNEDAIPKPSPAPYILACERLKLHPSTVLAIEDGGYGIESATRAGCRVMAIKGVEDLSPENVWRHLC